MSLSPGWRRQVRCQDKRAKFVLRTADAARVVVERGAKMPPATKQTVRRMALEVIPDLFDRIEFRGIAGEPFNMKSRIFLAQSSNEGTLVNAAIVPQQDDRAAQMAQERAEECGNVLCAVVPRLEVEIQTHPPADGRHTEGRQGGNAIMAVVVPNNGRLSPRPPGAPPTGYEKEAAFIKTNQMGSKFSRLFLYAATGNASSGQWPPRLAGWRDAPASDRTNRHDAGAAKGDWDDR